MSTLEDRGFMTMVGAEGAEPVLSDAPSPSPGKQAAGHYVKKALPLFGGVAFTLGIVLVEAGVYGAIGGSALWAGGALAGKDSASGLGKHVASAGVRAIGVGMVSTIGGWLLAGP